MKVCLETFGCRLNRAEALEEEAKYIAHGWEITSSHADAQLIVVRGCSVTARAQSDCEKLIEHLKRKYPMTRVIVTGCLPNADKGYVIRGVAAGAKAGAGAQATDPDPVPTRTARAYLKVQDGCNAACTFCTVPKFRGKAVSVPKAAVLAHARRFIDAGYHEIVVTGCNLSQYADGGDGLPELVAALAELEPASVRIRLGSVEPGPVAERLIPVMAAHANICRFLHLPLQSGSETILRGMKRPYHNKDVDQLAERAREAMPDIALCCDVITGFPGETEMDFHATFGQVKRLKFAKAHVFPFSERPGTPAAALPSAIGKDVRRHRAHLIDKFMVNARAEFARKFVGQTVEIVVERHEKVEGWTGEYLWCKAVGNAARKSLVKVFVTRSDGHVLHGRVVG